MTIDVLFFGILKDLFGSSREQLQVAEGADVGAVAQVFRQRAPEHESRLQAVAYAVNGEFAPPSTLLKDGDEIAMLPPVSGGSR